MKKTRMKESGITVSGQGRDTALPSSPFKKGRAQASIRVCRHVREGNGKKKVSGPMSNGKGARGEREMGQENLTSGESKGECPQQAAPPCKSQTMP